VKSMDKLIHKNMIKSSYKESHKIDDEKLQASSYAIDIGTEF